MIPWQGISQSVILKLTSDIIDAADFLLFQEDFEPSLLM
jgi:hypothetical protein